MKKLFILFFSIFLIGSILFGQDRQVVLSESFEETSCFPATWTVQSTTALTFTCNSTQAKTGTKSLYFTPLPSGPPIQNHASMLLPELSLANMSDVNLSFYYYIDASNSPSGTSFEVYVSSTDNEEASFAKLGETMNSKGSWIEFNQTLASTVKFVKIKATYENVGAPLEGWIDDVIISGLPAASGPQDILSESFEEASCFPATWTIQSTTDLTFSCNATQAKTGTKSLYFTPLPSGRPIQDYASMLLPELSLANMSDVNLSFYYYIDASNSPSGTSFEVYVSSTDNEEASFSKLGETMNSKGSWIEFNQTLASTVKFVKIKAIFENIGAPLEGWIDDVIISGLPASGPQDILSESFEEASCFPATWTVQSTTDLTFNCNATQAKTGTKSLYFTPLPSGRPIQDYASMLLPELSLANMSDVNLSFYYYIASSNSPSGTSFEVYVSSTDNEEASFSKLGETMNSKGSWIEFNQTLASTVKFVKIKAIFENVGAPLEGWIDDVIIKGTGGVAPPPTPTTLDSVFESFENKFPPTNWKITTDRSDGGTWKRIDSIAHSGTYAIASPPERNGNKTSSLTSPLLDLSKTKASIVSFYYKNNFSVGTGITPNSNFTVLVSTDGNTYEQVARFPVGTENQWKFFATYIDTAAVRVQIAITSRGGSVTDATTTILDDIYIGEIPETSCMYPANFLSTSKNKSSLTLDWTPYGAASEWQIHYGCPTFHTDLPSDLNAKLIKPISHPYVLNSLTDTTYHLRIRSICNRDTSDWSPIISEAIPITCAQPTNLNISNILPKGFTLNWNAVEGESSYILEIIGGESKTTLLVNNTTYTASNLLASTLYEIRLRTYCTEDDSSKWIYTSVSTDCDIKPERLLPWSTDFEDISYNNQFPACIGYTKNDNKYNVPVGTSIAASPNYTPRSGEKSAFFYGSQGNDGKCNDYIFTPGFELKQNNRYRFSFWYYRNVVSEANVYHIDAAIGTKKDHINMKSIGDTLILNTTTQEKYKQYVVEFSPEADGNYYIGIHAFTPELLSSTLNIDDISFERIFDCATPSNVKNTERTAHTLSFEWAGENADKWEVQYGKSDVNGFTDATLLTKIVTNSVVEISGLISETRYAIRVRAICAEGDTSGWTFLTHANTTPTCPQPTQIVVTDTTDTSFQISWTAGGTESKWKLSLKEDRLKSDITVYQTSDINSYTFNDLHTNRYYIVGVKALCGINDSSHQTMDTLHTLDGIEDIPYAQGFEKILKEGELPLGVSITNPFYLKTRTQVTPGSPFYPRTGNCFMAVIVESNDWLYLPAFKVKKGQEYELSAYWVSFDTINRLSLNYGYKKASSSMESITEVKRSSSKSEYKEIKGRFTASKDTTYYLGIYVQSGNATLSLDDITFKEVFTCDAPKTLKVLDITTQSARFSWESKADSFQLSYRIKDSISSPFTNVFTKQTSLMVSNLKENTQYVWKVVSICSFGNSETVVGSDFRTLRITCEIPINTTTSNITFEGAEFTWESEGTEFEIRYKHADSTNYLIESVQTKKFVTNALSANTNYVWSVRNVCNATYKSEWTSILAFKTLTAPCANPIALNSEDITTSSAKITWAANATQFQLRYKKEVETDYQVININKKEYELTNLDADTRYQWEVRSICGVNDTSNWSDNSFITQKLGNNKSEKTGISVYQNDNRLYVSNPSSIYFQQIEILTVNGQVVRVLPATSQEIISIPELKPAGIYFLRLISATGPVSCKIVVK